jgi:hypothetical protein
MHSQKPGLRAMLYGLTLKMEREEKLQKKLQRKMAGQKWKEQSNMNFNETNTCSKGIWYFLATLGPLN